MLLYTKIEKILDSIERSENDMATLSVILQRLVGDLEDDLGLNGLRLYIRSDDRFILDREYPPSSDHVGFEIPVNYEPVQEVLTNGFVLHEPGDPQVDRGIEEAIGVHTFAAIRIGEQGRIIVAFSLRGDHDREQVIFTLNTIRHAVNLKLSKKRLEDRVAQVKEIQLSLLPQSTPVFKGYDIWGDSRPAEEVGGDLYDYIQLSERSMGIAVADSAGHGLPAALQARDAIIGLRMGVEERLRITSTIEKLNRVVSRSALTSRFISLFYCEIEPNGNMVYCNAGHTPGLLWRRGEFVLLQQGGMVLGPNPEARYERGYTLMDKGSVLLLSTDGIVEATDAADQPFGEDRLRQIVQSGSWSSARELVELVFTSVLAFSKTDPPIDDQTVVAVIRTS